MRRFERMDEPPRRPRIKLFAVCFAAAFVWTMAILTIAKCVL